MVIISYIVGASLRSWETPLPSRRMRYFVVSGEKDSSGTEEVALFLRPPIIRMGNF
jgi:hypothetical protein